MIHYIQGTLTKHGTDQYIANTMFGIQVTYDGPTDQHDFFIYPHLDDTAKTIRYYAFATASDKSLFEKLLKVSGIGPKSALSLVKLGADRLSQAIQDFDVALVQSVPGIGPKTAKKILIELKGSFSDKDLIKINADDKLIANISKTLTTMGYDKHKVLGLLSKYPDPITNQTLSTVLQWMIGELK